MGKFNSLLNPTSQLSENYIYEKPERDFVGEEGEEDEDDCSSDKSDESGSVQDIQEVAIEEGEEEGGRYGHYMAMSLRMFVLLCSSGQGFFKILKGGCRDRKSKDDKID